MACTQGDGGHGFSTNLYGVTDPCLITHKHELFGEKGDAVCSSRHAVRIDGTFIHGRSCVCSCYQASHDEKESSFHSASTLSATED